MVGLARETIKWLHSLKLSAPVRNVRRDFSNGFLIAEIFSKFFPSAIRLESYDMGVALERKLNNWDQLEKFFVKHDIDINHDLIDGTLHCKPGIAEILVEKVYTLLTNRKARPEGVPPPDNSSESYQASLPSYARQTASMAVKANFKAAEYITQKDAIATTTHIEDIISQQKKLKQLDKELDPSRYGIKPAAPTGHATKPLPAISSSKPKQLTMTMTLQPDELLSRGNSRLEERGASRMAASRGLSSRGVSSRGVSGALGHSRGGDVADHLMAEMAVKQPNKLTLTGRS